jgi:hypothetical protein
MTAPGTDHRGDTDLARGELCLTPIKTEIRLTNLEEKVFGEA